MKNVKYQSLMVRLTTPRNTVGGPLADIPLNISEPSVFLLQDEWRTIGEKMGWLPPGTKTIADQRDDAVAACRKGLAALEGLRALIDEDSDGNDEALQNKTYWPLDELRKVIPEEKS